MTSIQHCSDAWCLKENEMELLRTDISIVRAICIVQLKDRTSLSFDVDIGHGLNNRSVGCGKVNVLLWPCVAMAMC